jgi:hypothetical protein
LLSERSSSLAKKNRGYLFPPSRSGMEFFH